ncbi:hypothetical protein [Tropicimonas sp. IMCC34011]|uniref:hypothetical protein n=1 Tax=Tropicimonas sp. IMCC34011 TaxID=2248759 RepID=UPI000E22E218|nr:hypothetical protein [Tropicimonas sp. IMCC34011]
MTGLIEQTRERADVRRKGTAPRENEMLFVVARESRDDAALMDRLAAALLAAEELAEAVADEEETGGTNAYRRKMTALAAYREATR